jgi:hypothetical protein
MSLARRHWVIIVVALVIAAAAYRYGYLIRGGVAVKLESRTRERTSQPFALADIAAFPWDRVAFLGPYDIQARADRALGFHWPDFRLFGLESSGGFSLIIFADAGHVVRAEKVGRCRPDFAKELRGTPVVRESAKFTIVATSDCPVLKLASALPTMGR